MDGWVEKWVVSGGGSEVVSARESERRANRENSAVRDELCERVVCKFDTMCDMVRDVRCVCKVSRAAHKHPSNCTRSTHLPTMSSALPIPTSLIDPYWPENTYNSACPKHNSMANVFSTRSRPIFEERGMRLAAVMRCVTKPDVRRGAIPSSMTVPRLLPRISRCW